MILNSGSAGGGGSIKIKTGTIPVSDYYVSSSDKKLATYNIGFKPSLLITFDNVYFTSNSYHISYKNNLNDQLYTSSIPHIICAANIGTDSFSNFIKFTDTGFTVDGTKINPYGSLPSAALFSTIYYVALG